MNCPACNQEMKKYRDDVSINPNDAGKKYIRTVYQCEHDDVWLTVESPKAVV